jgi:hypothetical protein
MVAIYATENATQRGNDGRALVGAVSASIKFIAEHIMLGTCSKIFEDVSKDTLDKLMHLAPAHEEQLGTCSTIVEDVPPASRARVLYKVRIHSH